MQESLEPFSKCLSPCPLDIEGLEHVANLRDTILIFPSHASLGLLCYHFANLCTIVLLSAPSPSSNHDATLHAAQSLVNSPTQACLTNNHSLRVIPIRFSRQEDDFDAALESGRIASSLMSSIAPLSSPRLAVRNAVVKSRYAFALVSTIHHHPASFHMSLF